MAEKSCASCARRSSCLHVSASTPLNSVCSDWVAEQDQDRTCQTCRNGGKPCFSSWKRTYGVMTCPDWEPKTTGKACRLCCRQGDIRTCAKCGSYVCPDHRSDPYNQEYFLCPRCFADEMKQSAMFSVSAPKAPPIPGPDKELEDLLASVPPISPPNLSPDKELEDLIGFCCVCGANGPILHRCTHCGKLACAPHIYAMPSQETNIVAAIRTFADVGGRSLDGEVDAPSKAFDFYACRTCFDQLGLPGPLAKKVPKAPSPLVVEALREFCDLMRRHIMAGDLKGSPLGKLATDQNGDVGNVSDTDILAHMTDVRLPVFGKVPILEGSVFDARLSSDYFPVPPDRNGYGIRLHGSEDMIVSTFRKLTSLVPKMVQKVRESFEKREKKKEKMRLERAKRAVEKAKKLLEQLRPPNPAPPAGLGDREIL